MENRLAPPNPSNQNSPPMTASWRVVKCADGFRVEWRKPVRRFMGIRIGSKDWFLYSLQASLESAKLSIEVGKKQVKRKFAPGTVVYEE